MIVVAEFAVITEIPAAEDAGNLACSFDIFTVVEEGFPGRCERISLNAALNLRTKVFELGEIIIVDEDGREIGGAQRKPNKWFVTCEYFTTLSEAIYKSQQMCQ